MKFVIAQMKHETNTFSPVPTPLFAFGKNGPYFDRDAFNAMKGTATPMGAFIDRAIECGAEIVTPVAGDSPPSGPVSHDAYVTMCDSIIDAVKQGCDALFLDLHGAMVVESTDDGEGDLLERLRRLAPKLPIAVALDLHANVTEKMVANCDVIAGYKTYPHVDMYEAGDLAARILLRYMKGEIKPVMAWGNRPVLAQTLKMNTAEGAMRDFVAAAKQAEQQGLLAATAFGGFPLADIPHAGLSAVVVADGNRQQAEDACKNILDLAWQRRDEFIYYGEPLADSIAKAMEISRWPNPIARPLRQLCIGRNARYHAGLGGGNAPRRVQSGCWPDTRCGSRSTLHCGRRRRANYLAGRRQDGHAVDQSQGRTAATQRHRARHHRWRVHYHGPAADRRTQLYGAHRGAGYRRGGNRDLRTLAGAVGFGRVHQRRHRSATQDVSCI